MRTKKRITKKQCLTSAKRCKVLLEKFKTLKQKHTTAALAFDSHKKKVLEVRDEARNRKQSYLASLEAYNHSVDRENAVERLPEMANKIDWMEGKLYRRREQVRLARMKQKSFSEQREPVKARIWRKQFLALRAMYMQTEEDHAVLSKQYVELQNLCVGPALDYNTAMINNDAEAELYEAVLQKLRTLNNEYDTLSDEVLCLKLQVLNAREYYMLAAEEHKTLLEQYEKSIKGKKQPMRTCRKVSKK